MEATHLFLEGDDLGWGAPGLGDDLGWGGEATRDAQGCGGGVVRSFRPSSTLLKREENWLSFVLLFKSDMLSGLSLC